MTKKPLKNVPIKRIARALQVSEARVKDAAKAIAEALRTGR